MFKKILKWLNLWSEGTVYLHDVTEITVLHVYKIGYNYEGRYFGRIVRILPDGKVEGANYLHKWTPRTWDYPKDEFELITK